MTKKVLIAYYSWSGTTKRMAEKIDQELPDSDLTEIKVKPDVFSSDMYETFDISKKQIAENNYPAVSTDIADFNKYDLILVGSPIWGSKPATPIYSFLQKLQGYNGQVASFYTHAGTIGDYSGTFKEWAKDLNVIGSADGDSKLDNWMLA